MKKIILKSLIAVFAVAFLIFGTVSFSTVAKAEGENIASGTAGDGISWVLGSDGTLTVGGSGTFDFEWYSPPWREYSNQITSVHVEEGITEIPDTLFSYLDNVKEIYIPSTVAFISNLAFDNSFGIEEFIIAEENEVYKSEDGVIYTKDGSTLVRFPSASATTEFTVPNDVLYISNEAFSCLRNLRSINIGENVVSIGANAFYNSTVEEISFNSSTNTLRSCLFSYTRFASFVIPDTVEYIESSVFFEVSALENLVIGSGVKKIGSYALYDTRNLSVIHYHGTEEGWSAINIDSENEDIYNKELHFVSYKEGYDATCADGHTGGLWCESCNAYFTGNALAPVKYHEVSESPDITNFPASCTENGYRISSFYCDDCGETMYEQYEVTDFALGHNIVDNVCQVCGFVCGHVDENFDGECDECKKPDIFTYNTIKIDTVGSVIVGDGDTSDEALIFISEKSGHYIIESSNNLNNTDPYVLLLNSDGVEITRSDDYDSTYNFRLEFEVEAGERYIIILKEWNGAGEYDYVLKKLYTIEEQPTSKNPELVISWDGADSYQWYEYTIGEEITSSNAGTVNDYGNGSAYHEGKGWTADFWEENEGSFFKIELKAGDAIYLDFGHAIDHESGIWGTTLNEGSYTEFGELHEDGKLIFVAPFDDVFEIYSYCISENTYLRAYILEKTEMEGETSSKLQNPKIGCLYSCIATAGEQTLVSDMLKYDYAVSHLPTTDEPYVEVNAGEATYQWYEITLDGEFTDENASSVDWDRGVVSTYTAEEGWKGVADKFGTDDCYDFATISVNAGARVIVIVEGNYQYGVGLYDYDADDGYWTARDENPWPFYVFEVSEAGSFTVYTYPSDESARVRIYLGTSTKAIDGATDNTYFAESDGFYTCEIVLENGAKEQALVYLTAHEHNDEDENYVCDSCKAEIPGKPDDGENNNDTGAGNNGAGNDDTDDPSEPSENAPVNTPDEEPSITTKIVIAAVAVSLVAVVAIALIVIKKKH